MNTTILTLKRHEKMRWLMLQDICQYINEIYTYYRSYAHYSNITNEIDDIEKEHIIQIRKNIKTLIAKFKGTNLHRGDCPFYEAYTVCTALANYDVDHSVGFVKQMNEFIRHACVTVNFISSMQGLNLAVGKASYVNDPTREHLFVYFHNYIFSPPGISDLIDEIVGSL